MSEENKGVTVSPSQVLDEVKNKIVQSSNHFGDELKRLRTGRANADMLDGVTVDAYGTQVPLNQVANITAPEPQLLQITPFDPNNLQNIVSSIRSNQTLGLNPSDDGRVVRVAIPVLTEDRRREISKQVGVKLEDCMVRFRSIRHDALNQFDVAKKDKDISEDDAKRYITQVEDIMSKAKVDVESIAKAKEQEIMTI
ncbi:ribosome recycling factor [Candidatus Saccharibacteria bacterium]|nr:ribosome recycling factor [Candidatus Saccharibacteria bacterium]